MALKKSYSSRFGTNHTQAYHKIDWVSCSTVSIGNMEIRVGFSDSNPLSVNTLEELKQIEKDMS